MKLSSDTISVLKNFSTIHQSIFIRAGKTIKTMNFLKSMVGEAEIPEEFTRDVVIYDLNQFLNCHSLVEDAEVLLEEHAIVIKNSTNSIEYRYSEPTLIEEPPRQTLQLPTEDVTLVLTDEQLQTARKAAAILQNPDITIFGDGESVILKVWDKTNSGCNPYNLNLGPTELRFSYNMKVDSLKILPGDYDVVISGKNSKFTSHSRPVVYFLAFEKDSEGLL